VTYTWRWFRGVLVTTADNDAGTAKIKREFALVDTPRTAVFEVSKGSIFDSRGNKLNSKEALAQLKVGSMVLVAFGHYEIDRSYLQAISENVLIFLDPRPDAKTRKLLLNIE
jgi:hypothetical protein